ncbi:Synaptobrevin [Ceratobasidium sp. AG-Ba]|nr:Synaptobrevin [Ceratobasidium sp. AG-Ba]
MRLYALSILQVNNGSSNVLASASDLSTFSFYQRSTVGEFLTFSSKTIAERTPAGQRSSVQEKTYVFHVFNRGPPENLIGTVLEIHHLDAMPRTDRGIRQTGVLISDEDYPVRPAFTLLTKALDEFVTSVPSSSYANPPSISFPQLQAYVAKYQDPKQADTIMRVQQELDETKIVLHKTIEAVLARGEKLDDLVDRSNQLSISSKQFYKTAKNKNSCCVIA